MVEVSSRNIAAAIAGYVIPPLLPIPILRLIPLISSTISLQWAIDEYQFLSSWISSPSSSPTYSSKANEILSEWFRNWGSKSTLILFTSFPFSAGSGFTNLYSLRNSPWTLNGSKTFYTLGITLTFGHMLFGPKALGLLNKIRNGEPDGKPVESLKVWLKMHILRTFVMDLPAVGCFLIAAVKASQGEY